MVTPVPPALLDRGVHCEYHALFSTQSSPSPQQSGARLQLPQVPMMVLEQPQSASPDASLLTAAEARAVDLYRWSALEVLA